MTKYSMRHLLCIALFLLYCTYGCFGAVVQQLPQKGKSALQTYTVSAPEVKGGPEWQPIRIAVYTKYVELAVKYCETMIMPQEFTNIQEEIEDEFDEFCDNEKNKKIMSEKKDILLKEVLPKAIKLHTDRLKVKRMKDNLHIRTNSVKDLPEDCGEFMIPKSHEDDGIPNADFVIYVSLSTTRDVAICSKDNQGRPTSAVIKFNLYDIKATRQYIRFTAHEIAHGLGFQHDFMKGLRMIETREGDLELTQYPGSKKRRSGGFHYVVKFKNAVEMLKKHYGCQNDEMRGLYLENGNGVTPSHWEREIAKDELMSTYIGEPTGMFYTALTLGVFHEMPFYSANFSMAEPMSWGNQSVCEFLQGKRDPKETDRPKMFCKKEEQDKILQCTSDRFALGLCLTKTAHDTSPEGYHYFSEVSVESDVDLMDDDPIIKPLMGTACEGGNKSLLPGSLFGRNSRCLNAKGLVLHDSKEQKSLSIAGVCAKVKCGNDNKVSVQLQGYEKNNKQWHECSDDKATVELDGSLFSKGTIECPKYSEVCTGLPKTNPLKIKYYTGTGSNDVYDVDANDENEEEKPTTTRIVAHTPGTSPGLVNEEQRNLAVKPFAQTGAKQHPEVHPEVPKHREPEKPKSENAQHNALSSVSSEGVSRVTNNDNNTAVGSGGKSNVLEKDVKPSQASNSPAPVVQSAQSLPPPSAPANPVDPAPSSSNLNVSKQETVKDQKEHLKPNTDTNLNDHPQKDENTAGVSSQHTDSSTKSRVQQNEMQTPPQLSKDHEETPNQDQSPNEVESHTADKVEKEVSSASSSSINTTPTAASSSPEGSSIPTKDVQTGETTQPKKDETTNNTSPSTTSPSTDVYERNNASTTAMEHINEEKNKDSAANKVEDLANQLVTIGNKNADSSITTSYIGACLTALLCVLLVL